MYSIVTEGVKNMARNPIIITIIRKLEVCEYSYIAEIKNGQNGENNGFFSLHFSIRIDFLSVQEISHRLTEYAE